MSVVFTYHFKKVIETSRPFIGESFWPIGRTGALRKTHTVELFFQKYSGGLSFLHEELHNHCIDCYFQTFVLLTELGHGTFRQFKSLLFP